MNTTSTEFVHFDRDVPGSFFNYQADQVHSLLSAVLAALGQAMEKLESHASGGDLPALRAEGHKLYGTTLVAGLPYLSGLSLQIQNLTDCQPAETESLLNDTRLEIELVTALIITYLEDLQPEPVPDGV